MSEAGLSKTTGWAALASSHPLLAFLDAALRGSGQVVFMNNPLTGALNFLAMFWGAWVGGTTLAVAFGSVVGTVVSTAVAQAFGAERGALRKGLHGFNGMLVGAGIATFLGGTALAWAVLVFASGVAAVVTLAVEKVLATWDTPGLTFPFIFTTWVVLLAAYRLPAWPIDGLPAAALAAQTAAGGVGAAGTAAAVADAFGLVEAARAVLTSVSQVFFVDDPLAGAIFLLALAVESRRCAALAAAGAALAVGCAWALGADRAAISHGLWGYSAVLTAPALGCVFVARTSSALGHCAAGTLLTVILQGAFFTLAQTAGIPPLTIPFVLSTWLFLLARRGREAAPGT